MPQKKYREALLAHADEARQQPRAAADSHRRAGRVRHRRASLPRAVARGCYELFSELGFRSLVMEYAPTADTTAKDYRLVDHARRARHLCWPSCARPGGSRCACCPMRRPRCAPASSASRSPRAQRRGRLRAGRPASAAARYGVLLDDADAGRRTPCRSSAVDDGAGGSEAAARGSARSRRSATT